MKSISIVSVLLGLLTLASEAVASPPAAYEGRRLYVSYCQLCHGTEGHGDGPLAKQMQISPADLTTTIRSRSDTILKKIISGQGRQTITGRDRHNLLSDAMPGWVDVFTEPQVDALIAFLRFLSRSKHEFMGDPEIGATVYQQYCVVCHGEEGDGDGIMTTLMRMTPSDHTNPNETNLLSNQQLFDTIATGRGQFMPAWNGVLSQEEIEGLVSYIRLLSNL
ncbi:MAG: cytochrome c [Magnetovibrio sp.]|nr:cytochrome c [Magnetovibrio sp.]